MTATKTTPPAIAESKAAFDPATHDGYVEKRAVHHCDVFLLGRIYRVNRWLVWCKGSKVEGRTWWQHAVLDFPWNLTQMDDAARALSVSRSWLGRDLAAHAQ